MTVSVAIIVVAVLVVVLAIWQTIQIQAVRKKVDAVPADGNTVMMLQNLHHRASVNDASIQALDARLQSLERRMPDALTRFGVIAYDAFGNITGNQSRSIAMLADSGDGIVLSILAAREETLFYMKEVRSGRGVDELAPEEQQAVDRAMGR